MFTTLGLSEALTRAVAEQGYTEPTPIQLQAIPVVLAGRDLLGAAQTGTGKTAGFTLPMLQRLSANPPSGDAPGRHPIRALILTPTRELAAQVHESVRTYGKNMRLRSAVIFGGVGAGPQIEALRRGVDIVVATPGRLLDHVEQKVLDLSRIEILVLDEADRMLDMGFIPAIRRVLALLPRERQNLLFSATFPEEIRSLASSFMHDPVTIEVARRNTPAELVAQVAHPVDAGRKRELLAHLIKHNDWRQVLVFTRTKHGANRLAEQLVREGIEADAIHGNKSQNARTRALGSFKNNELRVLVATDIAARGLDIDTLPHVVNYDLPHVAEDYIHRIGRTGRAGSEGEAVSLVSAEDKPLFAAIERLMNRSVELRVIPGFEPGQGSPASTQSEAQQARRRDAQPRRPGSPSRRPDSKPGQRDAQPRQRGAPPRRRDGRVHGGQPRVRDSQPRFDNSQARPDDAQPRFDDEQPRFNDAQPHFDDAQPRFDDAQPRFDDAQPRFNDAQPNYDEEQPRFHDAQPRTSQSPPRGHSGQPRDRQPRRQPGRPGAPNRDAQQRSRPGPERAPARSSLPGQDRFGPNGRKRRPGQSGQPAGGGQFRGAQTRGEGLPGNSMRDPAARNYGAGPNAARRGPPRGGPGRPPHSGPRGEQGRGGPRFRSAEAFAQEERKLQLLEHRRRAKEGGPEFAPPPPAEQPEPKVKQPVQISTKPRRSIFAALLGRGKDGNGEQQG